MYILTGDLGVFITLTYWYVYHDCTETVGGFKIPHYKKENNISFASVAIKQDCSNCCSILRSMKLELFIANSIHVLVI